MFGDGPQRVGGQERERSHEQNHKREEQAEKRRVGAQRSKCCGMVVCRAASAPAIASVGIRTRNLPPSMTMPVRTSYDEFDCKPAKADPLLAAFEVNA